MSYTIRNTLILALLVVIVAVFGGYTISYRLNNSVRETERTLKEKQQALEELRMHNLMFDEIEARLRAVQAAWKTMPKRLYSEESTTKSFAYFNKLALEPGSRIYYNYTLTGSDEENGLRYNKYTLVGEASFRSLYNFIWKLEHLPPLYRIEELDIKPVDPRRDESRANLNYVNFILMLTAFAYDQSELEARDPLPAETVESVRYNPFYPLVQDDLPPNNGSLLDVNGASLLGLTHDTAFLRDAGNKTWILKKGDAVYLGTLTAINTVSNTVHFTLNEGGFVKHVTLTLFSESNKSSGENHE